MAAGGTVEERARARVLDAAEELFYARGVRAVGMDAVRGAAGVSLKRFYQFFPAKDHPAKDHLVEEFLRRRDHAWRAALARHADARPTPRARLLAVFDWLYEWFAEPDFRGCAFLDCFAELGGTSPAVAEAARAHKARYGPISANSPPPRARPRPGRWPTSWPCSPRGRSPRPPSPVRRSRPARLAPRPRRCWRRRASRATTRPPRTSRVPTSARARPRPDPRTATARTAPAGS